jgi:hypothetical protein
MDKDRKSPYIPAPGKAGIASLLMVGQFCLACLRRIIECDEIQAHPGLWRFDGSRMPGWLDLSAAFPLGRLPSIALRHVPSAVFARI